VRRALARPQLASVWALRDAPGPDILGQPWMLLSPQPTIRLPGTSVS